MANKKVYLIIILVLFSSILIHTNKNMDSNSQAHDIEQVSTHNSFSNIQKSYSINNEVKNDHTGKPRSSTFVEGNLSYIIRNNHFEIFDINNPANPILLYSFENHREDSKYVKIFVNNSYVYLLSNLFVTDDSCIDIFNCTDIINVNLITSIQDDEESDLFFVIDHLVYLITRREVHIYELQSENEYVFLKSTLSLFNETGGYFIDDYIDFSLSNETLYLLGFYAFFIIDLTDPINPTVITDSGFYQSSGYFSLAQISVRNNIAYIFQGNGFFAFNLTNLSNITLQSSLFYSNYPTYSYFIDVEVDFWVTEEYSFLLFTHYILVIEMDNGNPINITDGLECLIGNVKYMITITRCTGLFLSNDLIYITKKVNSIDREILIIVDATNTSSLTYLWIMDFADPFKFSNLALYGGIAIVILFVIVASFLIVYYLRSNQKQNKNDEVLEIDTAEKLQDSEKSFVAKSTSNKLLSSGFILLAIQNLFVLVFIIPTILGWQYPVNNPDFTYTMNIPFLLDLVAIMILIIGFGFKIAEKKSKKTLFVILIWVIWMASTIFYRVFWGLPSYDYLITAYTDSSKYFTTYLDYLIHLPFLLSTIIFSIALIMTAIFMDIKISKAKIIINMAILNGLFGAIFYFGRLSDIMYTISLQHLDDPTGGIFVAGFGGFVKGIIVPVIAIVIFSLVGSDYIKKIKSLSKTQITKN